MSKYIFFIYFIINLACTFKKSDSIKEHFNSKDIIEVPSKVNEIPPPKGYKKVPHTEGVFADYLGKINLKKDRTVYLYNGEKKGNQSAQFAVLDISVSNRDLQQCADAVMRLRAEYFYGKKMYDKIRFNSVEGKIMRYVDWANGSRNLLKINNLNAPLKSSADVSRPQFLKYMDFVFAYASTLSLEKELKPVSTVSDIQVGDVFIKGGSPGHAVIVMAVAKNEATGKKTFLLAQSYMPAQDIHILVNPADQSLSPWYSEDFGNELVTPEWVFKRTALRRF